MRRHLTRPRARAAASLVALAAVSAALAQSAAQTVEELDLAAIKARGSEQVREAQALVDAVAHRGEAHQAEAEDLRDAGLAATASVQPGQAESVIAGVVEAQGIGLVVMGAYGHSRLRTLVIGKRG